MHQFLLKNLFLGSLLILLIYSCAPTASYKLQGKVCITDKEIKPLIPDTGALLFKAKLDVYAKHFSGLIIVKQTDSLTAHVTFVTEVGMKMFDFEIKKHALKLVYIFEPLNQAKLIKLLTNDLELLLLQKTYTKTASVYSKTEMTCYLTKEPLRRYYFVNSRYEIQKIRERGYLFEKIKLDYSYINQQSLQQISLKHKGLFPLKMKFIAVTKNN